MDRKRNGATIGEKHTYNDFGLILESKVISAPVTQTKYVTIPCRNGKIDMSEVLTGNVRYIDRKITMNFVKAGEVQNWNSFRSELQNAFQGQKMQIIFDDDLAFYWIGRVNVELSSLGMIANVTITADVDPYKYSITTSAEDWLWDPFDFEEGVINEAGNIVVDGEKSITITCSQKWENPIIVSDSSMTVTFKGQTFNIVQGSQVLYDTFFEAGDNTLVFNGNGIVSVIYRGGSL